MRIPSPHPFVLLLGGVLVAAVLTWILPAGTYERRTDPATGSALVVAGTYQTVDASPVGLAEAVLAVPRGIANGVEIIIVVLLVGGAYALLEPVSVVRSVRLQPDQALVGLTPLVRLKPDTTYL
jgi:uncharacterized ion transporter superfamily protein YfcC